MDRVIGNRTAQCLEEGGLSPSHAPKSCRKALGLPHPLEALELEKKPGVFTDGPVAGTGFGQKSKG